MITLSCPGSDILIENENFSRTIQAKCISGTNFKINNQEVDIHSIQCAKQPQHSLKDTKKNCNQSNRTTIFEIGFQISTEIFVKLIEVCFDKMKKTTLYTNHILTKSIHFRETGSKRPNFIENTIYNLSRPLYKIYSRRNHRNTVNRILGLPLNSTKYITKNNFLSRGHLAPKADFFYSSQQLATFYYINVAPQWQTFNGGNWARVERSVRSLAVDRTDLIIYTGSYGVFTLPHEETGESEELFLFDEHEKLLCPIPEFFWKIVIDLENQQGVALIGINDPYRKNFDEKICRDVSQDLEWLKLRSEVKYGYVYACTVGDFLKNVNLSLPVNMHLVLLD